MIKQDLYVCNDYSAFIRICQKLEYTLKVYRGSQTFNKYLVLFSVAVYLSSLIKVILHFNVGLIICLDIVRDYYYSPNLKIVKSSFIYSADIY